MLRGSIWYCANNFWAAATPRSDAHSSGAAMYRVAIPVFS